MLRRIYEGLPPKKDRVWLSGCEKLACRLLEPTGQTLRITADRGGRPSSRHVRTPDRSLCRQRLLQCRPYKCPLLRELLWDWFVDVRRSVAGILSPKFVLLKASALATMILQEQRKVGHITPMPQLDKHWLLRWKRDMGVVFRRPNARFKCSRSVLKSRHTA